MLIVYKSYHEGYEGLLCYIDKVSVTDRQTDMIKCRDAIASKDAGSQPPLPGFF